jgi:ABC-type phosphonate transport system ATPase subunit
MFGIPIDREILTQGDLFMDCPLVGLDSGVVPVDLTNTLVNRWTATVVVLTQACDLAQGKADRVLVA